MEMCFHGNQLSWAIKHPIISLCLKYHSPGFICFPTILAPVISSLDEIYCSYLYLFWRLQSKNDILMFCCISFVVFCLLLHWFENLKYKDLYCWFLQMMEIEFSILYSIMLSFYLHFVLRCCRDCQFTFGGANGWPRRWKNESGRIGTKEHRRFQSDHSQT